MAPKEGVQVVDIHPRRLVAGGDHVDGLELGLGDRSIGIGVCGGDGVKGEASSFGAQAIPQKVNGVKPKLCSGGRVIAGRVSRRAIGLGGAGCVGVV